MLDGRDARLHNLVPILSLRVDVKVSRWMGHADAKMVHERYGHLMAYDADIDVLTVRRAGWLG